MERARKERFFDRRRAGSGRDGEGGWKAGSGARALVPDPIPVFGQPSAVPGC